MTTINKSTFDTVTHMNSKLNEITEQPHQTQSNERPKTIHEVRTENRPAVSNALSRLGRPPIGVQLTSRRLTEAPAAPEPMAQTMPPGSLDPSLAPRTGPQGNRGRQLTPQQQTYPVLQSYRENGTRIMQILTAIERRVWGFGDRLSYSEAARQTQQLRDELAERIKGILNTKSSEGAVFDPTTEQEIANWYAEITSEIGRYISSNALHFMLTYGTSQSYGPEGPRETNVGGSQYYELESYGLGWLGGVSHRVTRVYTPQIRLNYQITPAPTPAQPVTPVTPETPVTPAPVTPVTPAPTPAPETPVTPVTPAPTPAPPIINTDERSDYIRGLTDEQFLQSYIVPNYFTFEDSQAIKGKNIIFRMWRSETGLFMGSITGSGIFDNTYTYNLQPEGVPTIAGQIGSQLFGWSRTLYSTISNILNRQQTASDFVWLGPDSPNNAMASGIADLISFFHDTLYLAQGAGGTNQNIQADRLSNKMARVCQYYLDAIIYGRLPLVDLKTEVQQPDGTFKNFFLDQNKYVSESGWLKNFQLAFGIMDTVQETIGRGTTIEEIRFNQQDFLDIKFLIRQQKLKILYVYSEAINQNILNFDSLIPDPSLSTFLINSEAFFNTLNLQSTTWDAISESYRKAIQKLDNWILTQENTPNKNNALIVRIQYFSVISNLMEIGKRCVDLYYIGKLKKPSNDWELILAQDFDKSVDKIDAEELDITQPIADDIIPVILNQDDNSKLLFILRHLVIDGAVAY